ncbi:MAG: DNA polymerase III subunit beta [Chloroflexi bacterium]|nr:DNA polymerase III subunit beta [Chloroflexota bacterium]
MKLSCLQENLSKGLATVGRAVATRTTLPITQNVLLSTDQARLRLAATNLEIAVSTWIGAKVEEEGAITIPARLLTELVASLPNDRIDLVVADRPRGLRVQCLRVTATIHGTDAEEFPPIPSVEGGVTARLSPQGLRGAISQVVFAAATEDSRPVLTGIKVELEGQGFTFAAADGFRLAVRKGATEEALSEAVSFILPAKTLAELNRLLGDQDEPVELTVSPSKSQVLFRLKNVEMVSQLIQGTFPNYGQLIPQSYATRAVVSVPDFLRATRTASIFARDGSGIIRVQLFPGAPGKLTVSSRAEEMGENAGELDAKVEGGEAKVAFNSKYLLDILQNTGRDEVALEVTTPSSPGVFRPVGDDGYVHVVMPMFVQW